MERQDYIERLAAIKDRYGKWTPDDRLELKAMVKELGIKHSFRGKCSSCYNDAFHLVMHHFGLRMADLNVEVAQTSGRYVYLPSVDTIWMGRYGKVTLNEYTPDEIVERYIEVFPNQNIYRVNDFTEDEVIETAEEPQVEVMVETEEIADVQDIGTDAEDAGEYVPDEFNEEQITF